MRKERPSKLSLSPKRYVGKEIRLQQYKYGETHTQSYRHTHTHRKVCVYGLGEVERVYMNCVNLALLCYIALISDLNIFLISRGNILSHRLRVYI